MENLNQNMNDILETYSKSNSSKSKDCNTLTFFRLCNIQSCTKAFIHNHKTNWFHHTTQSNKGRLLIIQEKCGKPVEMPQLRTQTLSRGAAGLILAKQPKWTTVYSLKVEVPTKWWMGCPFLENLVFPSLIITPRSVLIRRRSHILLSSDWQWRHSPHSPVKTGRTWSPGWRSFTPSPTLSTILLQKQTIPNPQNQYLHCKKQKKNSWSSTYPPASCPKMRGNNGVCPYKTKPKLKNQKP